MIDVDATGGPPASVYYNLYVASCLAVLIWHFFHYLALINKFFRSNGPVPYPPTENIRERRSSCSYPFGGYTKLSDNDLIKYMVSKTKYIKGTQVIEK